MADVPSRPSGRDARRGSLHIGRLDAAQVVTSDAVCVIELCWRRVRRMASPTRPHERVVSDVVSQVGLADLVGPELVGPRSESANRTACGVRPFSTDCTQHAGRSSGTLLRAGLRCARATSGVLEARSKKSVEGAWHNSVNFMTVRPSPRL